MDDSVLIRSISETVEGLDQKVQGIASASQRRYRMGIEAGQTVHEFGEYEPADDEGREAVRAACTAAYDEILEDVDRHIRMVTRDMSEPAKADDAATVALTLAREHVTEGELQALLDRYKGNYQLASAITERAHRGDMHLENEPEQVRIFRGDAAIRARAVTSRYARDRFMDSPDSFATDVVMALRHIDMFGRRY